MSVASFRMLSTGGFLVGAAAGSLVALGSRSGWWLDLPAIVGPLVAIGALLLHAWAIRKGRAREELAAYALAAVALLPYGLGAPSAAAWSLAAVAAVSFLLAVEAAGTARRLAKLEEAEGREAHVERIATPLRNAILAPLAGLLVLLVLARPIGKAVFGLFGGAMSESLEASGVYGIAVGALLLSGVLALAAYVRHVRQDAAA